MTGEPRRGDLLDEIVAADQVAAEKRERKERRVFIVAVAAVVVLALIGASASVIAFTAMTNQREAREAASRRIDLLNDEIEELAEELVAEVAENSRVTGELNAKIEALQEQVRQLGGEPVVVVSSSPSSAPSTTTSTAPPSTTTTAPPTPERPAPEEGGGLCLGPIQIGACS